MYLSLWIIKDCLKEYQIESHIQDGTMNIRNISPLYHGGNIHLHTLYVGPSEEYFHSIQNKVICVNNNDYIIISNLSAEDAFERINQIMEDYLEWDLNVRDAIDAHCTLQDIIESAASVFHETCGIFNSVFTLHALAGQEYTSLETYGPLSLNAPLQIESIYSFIEENHSYLDSREPYLFYEPVLSQHFLIQNIYLNGFLWGFCFISIQDSEIAESTRQLFHVLHSQLLRWWNFNHEVQKTPEENPYFLSLLTPSTDYPSETLSVYFQQIGWKKDDTKYVLRILDTNRNYLIYQKLSHQISQLYSGCYLLHYEDSIVLIINERFCTLKYILEQTRLYSYKNHIAIGISYPYTDLLRTNIAYEQAKAASLVRGSDIGTIRYCQDYMTSYVNSALKNNPSFEKMHPTLLALQEYDCQHHTEFYCTLRCYLYEERSVKRSAARLKIHKNTLLFRIKKISELINLNLEDTNTRTNLILAFLLME